MDNWKVSIDEDKVRWARMIQSQNNKTEKTCPIIKLMQLTREKIEKDKRQTNNEELKKYTINLYDLLGALIEYGQHDKQFKLGDIIKYDPVSVVEIAREFLDKHS